MTSSVQIHDKIRALYAPEPQVMAPQACATTYCTPRAATTLSAQSGPV